MFKKILSFGFLGICVSFTPLFGVTLEELDARLRQLESENQELREKIARLESREDSQSTEVELPQPEITRSGNSDISGGTDPETFGREDSIRMERESPSGLSSFQAFPRMDSRYHYEMLDPTTRINRKQQYLLEKKQREELPTNGLLIGGAVTAIADYQRSNTDSKFGYLMRHPTAANQVTRDVSEAVIHSAQLALTGNLGSWLTAYSEFLYDPQQSFGTGTITDLERNQIQLRRGYVLLGDLEKSPFFLSVGKMATPFGLTDTVNPFTASTVWHAFGGLAYGAQLGYVDKGWNVSVMGIQGGSQFRAHNTPVDGTNVPSKLNNYVVDANYTFSFPEPGNNFMIGGSYQRGSAYCQGFPVFHFEPCDNYNPAFDFYGQLNYADFQFQFEYAETLDLWPGYFNPTIPQFAAHEVVSWGVGGKYSPEVLKKNVDFSLEFSRFVAGPDGAPWENQDQWVLGVSGFLTPGTKIFTEYIHTQGYVPLNFVSGGNLGPGQTHSSNDAKSDILLMGINAAY